MPLDRPWTAPGARDLDNQTFETWIVRNLRTPTGRTYFRVATEAVFSAESGNLSALHALFYAHSGTDLEGLLSTDQGAQQDRIVGWSIRVSESMAAALGDRLTLDSPVRRIEQGNDRVAVTTRGGEGVRGRPGHRHPSTHARRASRVRARPPLRGGTSSPSASRPAR